MKTMINHDLIERNETNKSSKGGTELLQDRLYDGLVPRELLEQFQIVFSRVRELDENKFRIFYAHDLPGDPESEFLHNEGWKKFHRLVFVSNWQMQKYIDRYNIPWNMCIVIENSINPIDMYDWPLRNQDQLETIKLVYTSTPHRGLNILYAAFDALAKKVQNVELNVFSSFNLYGWGQRDEEFKPIFELLDSHPKIINHGTKSNDEIREFLGVHGDIFVHPGVWPETSCLCLIEAMSAGLMCIHSNYGALYETAAGYTHMYQLHEDMNAHATILYHILMNAVGHVNSEHDIFSRKMMRIYANAKFDWKNKAKDWTALLGSIVQKNPDKRLSSEYFTYTA